MNSLITHYLSTIDRSADSLNLYFTLGNTYRNMGEVEMALNFLDKATELNLAQELTTGKSYLSKALLYRAIADYAAAQINYESAIKNFHELGASSHLLSACYQNLGKIYNRLGDYDRASDLFEKDLALGLSAQDSIVDYFELGNLWGLGYAQAISNYQRALDFEQITAQHQAIILANLAELYAETGEADKAWAHIEEALPIFHAIHEMNPGLGGGHLFEAYRTLGDIHTYAQNYQKAEKAYQESLAYALEVFGSYQGREMGKIFIQKGNLALYQAQYSEALADFQQALQCALPTFHPDQASEHPDAEDFYAENLIVEALIGKANAFEGLYQNNKGATELTNALACYELVSEVENMIRLSYSFEHAKLGLATENHNWSEDAIKTAYELYQISQDKSYIHQAFAFAERSKAWVLLELMKDASAKFEANIPVRLLEREQSLKQQILGYEEQMVAYADHEEFVTELKAERFTLRNELLALIDSLELQYPKYYESKYQFEQLDIHTVQHELIGDSQALIEYFWGQKDHVFAFMISKEGVEMVNLGAVKTLETNVRAFYQLLQQPKEGKRYKISAYQLYQQLLAPLEQASGNLPERLLIVPDGMLGYLPFDALLTEAVSENQSFKQIPYLLNNHSISYAYSGSLLREIHQRGRSKAGKGFLGIGPEFKDSETYALLSYSIEELEHIQQTLGKGKLLVKNKATKEHFLDLASAYNILHISSHAAVEDGDPMGSWIAFSDAFSDDHRLSVRDLYGMSLHADLAVLGACQTGYGDILHGEGIMSLARGFIYAGCKSLVTTLWEANHWSTHQIMQNFYEQLVQDLPKDEALRSAKLAYLKSEQVDKQAAHPYYWAAATPIGDMQPLELSSPKPKDKWLFLSGILLLSLLGWLGLSRSKPLV